MDNLMDNLPFSRQPGWGPETPGREMEARSDKVHIQRLQCQGDGHEPVTRSPGPADQLIADWWTCRCGLLKWTCERKV